MVKKFLLAIVWFPITLIILFINLGYLTINNHSRTIAAPLSTSPLVDGTTHITSPQGTGYILGASIIPGDARSLLLESFLIEHDSPMAPYASMIVQESDAKGIDFRLVVAIAMCESNAGKRMPKRDEYNAWGIAVYTGQLSGASFQSWPHAIEWVTTYIKEKYYDIGLVDLRAIGAKWAPPSVENGYSWTNCVEQFQGSIL